MTIDSHNKKSRQIFRARKNAKTKMYINFLQFFFQSSKFFEMASETKEPNGEQWANIIDKTKDVNKGKVLKRFEDVPMNPLMSNIDGLHLLIWMYENRHITMEFFNPVDLSEGWYYNGPLPSDYTFVKLFGIFDKSDTGRCSLQFKNGDRKNMRLVIRSKEEPRVIKHVSPFHTLDDPVQVLQVHAHWQRAKDRKREAEEKARKVVREFETLMDKVMGRQSGDDGLAALLAKLKKCHDSD